LDRTLILLGEMPRMLLDIVGAALKAQPDMEVVEAAPGANSLLQFADRSRPDVVIIGADDPNIAHELVMSLPRLKVLAVTGSDSDASLYELRPQRVQLGAVTPRILVEEIRRRTGEAAAWSD
jgi:DNA-binding NarL/FixJ family response regulator